MKDDTSPWLGIGIALSVFSLIMGLLGGFFVAQPQVDTYDCTHGPCPGHSVTWKGDACYCKVEVAP